MTNRYNHIKNQHAIRNHLFKWMNVTPSNMKLNEVENLLEIIGDIKSVQSKRVFGQRENNGPWQEITLDEKNQICQITQIKLDGSSFVKEYDSYEITQKQTLKEIDWNGQQISIENRIYDGYENLLERRYLNQVNSKEVYNKSDITIQSLKNNVTLINLNKQSSKIKYYLKNKSIYKKIVYINNKYENSVETYLFNTDFSISKYTKQETNKYNRNKSSKSRVYEHKHGRVFKITERTEYQYPNSKDETIEIYNRFEYNQNGLLKNEIFNNVYYDNKERVIANYEYNDNKLATRIENQSGLYTFRYLYDQNGNWVNRIKEFRNEKNHNIEETIREIKYK